MVFLKSVHRNSDFTVNDSYSHCHVLALPSSQMATFCFASILWYCFSYER